MTGQTGGETGRGSGIGPRLRSARERRGLTVEQAALKLHLDPAVLQSLEAEDFGALGAPIFVKGYVGRYAELVGESAESLQQLLAGAVIPVPDLTRIPRARAEGSRFMGPATIALAAGLVLATSLWWGISRWHERHAPPTPARIAPRKLIARRIASGTPAVAGKAAVAMAAPALRAAVARRAANRAGQAAAGPSKGEVRITLKFSTASWVEVKDAAGKRLYRAMAPAAAVRVFKGPAPLHVVLGYAPAATLVVDGRATSIGALAQVDHVASFEVAADGRVLSGARPGGE